MNRVYIAHLEEGDMGIRDVLAALEWLEWERWLPENARVFVKPNLTWPEHIPGVTTTPQAIESVVAALRTRTGSITVGESDGGYGSFAAEEAFRGHRLYDLAKKYGVRLVNLSGEPAEETQEQINGHPVRVCLPRILLREIDVFISLPVPKVHVMTGVSLAFKNQWGCNPSTMRLKEHPEFEEKIVAINRRLNPKVIFDGTFFLDGAGPLTGDAVRRNLLMASDCIGAADAVCCAVMGIDWKSVRHLRLASREGLLPAALSEIVTNQPPDLFMGRRFATHRAILDWISLAGFHSRRLTWLFWFSPLADALHRGLNAARTIGWMERWLYGRAGRPPALGMPSDPGRDGC